MINDLKELEKLLKMCRKQGISEINISGTMIKFGDLPVRASAQSDESDGEPDGPSPAMSEDELIYYAVQSAGMQ